MYAASRIRCITYTDHRPNDTYLYLTLHKTMSQGTTVAANPERGIGNDPEPLGVAFLQGPSCTSMISLTLSHSSCLSLRLEIWLH